MDSVIRLQEWTRSAPMTLSEESLRILAGLGHLLDLRPDGRRWTLRPKGIVGRIELREGTLELRPKHPVQSLCQMIAAVASIARGRAPGVDLTSATSAPMPHSAEAITSGIASEVRSS